jgi:hypothetical protein
MLVYNVNTTSTLKYQWKIVLAVLTLYTHIIYIYENQFWVDNPFQWGKLHVKTIANRSCVWGWGLVSWWCAALVYIGPLKIALM